MRQFTTLRGIVAPLPADDIDTDQIVPARFLSRRRGDGLADCLFHDRRFAVDGSEIPSFVLNREPYRNAPIIVAGRNFGCGSSREHAVYALLDFGIRCVIAPSFGDIFHNNCLLNGLLPVAAPPDVVERLARTAIASPHSIVAIDLERQSLATADGLLLRFEINEFRKECLLLGLDDIDFTLRYEAQIARHERAHRG